jgi:hypothetical protein
MRRRRQPAMSIVKRATTWLAVIVAAATTATVVGASPSFAVGCSSICVPTSVTGTSTVGTAYFNADTQVLSIKDTHADGYGVAVINYRFDLANVGPYYGWNRDGYNTTTYYYLHMPYLGEIKFYVCPEKGGIIFESGCGQSAFGYAGGEI